MDMTYEIRFDDEDQTRSRGFKNPVAARWWASTNRPHARYVIVPRYANPLRAARAYLLRRREPTVSS
jgi:hypothetical protein